MKKVLTAVLLLLLSLWIFSGCQSDVIQETTEETTLPIVGVDVGICLPENKEPWAAQGKVMEERLVAAGYTTRVEYAENDVQYQLEQVKQLVKEGPQCLVIAPVDSLSLLPVLEMAAQKNIPVISYDRLLLQSDNIRLYIAFDSLNVGKAVGRQIVEQKKLDTAQTEGRSYRLELFMGAPEEHGAMLMHEGIMAELKPYLDSGVLTCGSGRVSFEDTCVPEWSATLARQRLQQYIGNYYEGAVPDICVAASVDMAAGCGDILSGTDAAMFTPDARLDYSQLTAQCITAVQQLLAGEAVTGNGNTVHNGAVTVEAYLIIPEMG